MGRIVYIVGDKTFKSANSKLNGLLKQKVATGKNAPTLHKAVITKPGLQQICMTHMLFAN
ncbi:hypothetical protein KUTeg_014354 [Tegillarca granosa]|uniref:Uncharacterized protein n=1 Tax=Tegillarca granosa TaxID=220873 RepID=A0ABQ9F1K6_TEGGR|nr:hypothetical protein KUTeg_014354 [Tegillarca granosa]